MYCHGMSPDEVEAALSAWRRRREALDNERDELVRAALAAGVNVRRVHMISGIARGTIYRIRDTG